MNSGSFVNPWKDKRNENPPAYSRVTLRGGKDREIPHSVTENKRTNCLQRHIQICYLIFNKNE